MSASASRRDNTDRSLSNRCAHLHESYRTLRDGSFGVVLSRHFVPGYDRCCPYGTRWQTFRNSIELPEASVSHRNDNRPSATSDS